MIRQERSLNFKRLFNRDYERYDGVRPIIIHGMRVGYLVVFLFLGTMSWKSILTHEGPWDSVPAAALCMWAAHALLSLIGVFHPLKMLPLLLFEVFYKLLWLSDTPRRRAAHERRIWGSAQV
jgi:hypothetical protein